MDGDEHAWAGHHARVDGIAKADINEVAAAHVADGCEAGVAGIPGGADGSLSYVPLEAQQRSSVVVGIELLREMSMSIDKAWKKGCIAEVKDGCAGRDSVAANGLNLCLDRE